MANLLYWLLIVTSFGFGFRGYPVWTILLLGVVAAVTYLIERPAALEIGTKERGAAYPLMIAAASVLPAAVLFAFGALTRRAILQF
jgi:hypothetical protein